MNETYINALLNTVRLQRDTFANQVAEQTALYAVLQQEFKVVSDELAVLKVEASKDKVDDE